MFFHGHFLTDIFSTFSLFFQYSALYGAVAISFSEAIPLNATPAIKITLDVTPCDTQGSQCDPASTEFAAAQLYCGTNADGQWDYISGKNTSILIIYYKFKKAVIKSIFSAARKKGSLKNEKTV